MDSEGSKQKSSSQSQSFLPVQEKGIKTALDTYLPLIGNGPNKAYAGERVAPLTDFQNVLMGGVNNIANQFLDTFGNITKTDMPLFNETGKALADTLSGATGAAKTTADQVGQYFNDRIKTPAMDMLKNDLLPTVDEGYTGGNFWSTARGKARDNMTQDIGDQLIQQRSQLEWDVNQANQALDESNANRILSAVPQAINYSQMPAQETMNNLRIAAGQVEGMAQLLGIGSLEQTQQQKEIEARMAQFFEQNQVTNPDDMAIILSLLGMNYSTSTSYGRSDSWGNQLGYLWASPEGVSKAAALGV